jgi:hypothetical protein
MEACPSKDKNNSTHLFKNKFQKKKKTPKSKNHPHLRKKKVIKNKDVWSGFALAMRLSLGFEDLASLSLALIRFGGGGREEFDS